jgi:hypothetical protein
MFNPDFIGKAGEQRIVPFVPLTVQDFFSGFGVIDRQS